MLERAGITAIAGRTVGKCSGGEQQRLIHSGDTDDVARRLLNQTPARDLEITSRGLEEAFIALTGDGAAGPAGPDGESQAAI